ncbi:MAG TPA: four helix bundle protein [Gemmatimonadaceae bacterium]
MSVRSYQDLEVGKESIELVLLVYDCVDRFPPHERFAMSPQVRRAAVSIPSNIARDKVDLGRSFSTFWQSRAGHCRKSRL